jgi:hypothetical protein
MLVGAAAVMLDGAAAVMLVGAAAVMLDGAAAGACELGAVVLQVELSVPGPHPAVGVDCVGCELGAVVLVDGAA